MAWTNHTWAVGQILTATQMTQVTDNFTALAQGLSGAPAILNAALNSATTTPTSGGIPIANQDGGRLYHGWAPARRYLRINNTTQTLGNQSVATRGGTKVLYTVSSLHNLTGVDSIFDSSTSRFHIPDDSISLIRLSGVLGLDHWGVGSGAMYFDMVQNNNVNIVDGLARFKGAPPTYGDPWMSITSAPIEVQSGDFFEFRVAQNYSSTGSMSIVVGVGGSRAYLEILE